MKLSVKESGQQHEESILFLHGLGTSGWMWHDQIEALQSGYHCLNVDLPGNGESYQVEWRSFADTAAQLAALVAERAHGGQAHVVGLSLGGYTALHLLAGHPERVRTLIISGVTSAPMPNERLFRLLVPLLSRVLRWDWVLNLSARAMQLPEEVRPLYRRDGKRLTPAGIRRVYDEVIPFQLPLDLGERPHPVLAVAGSKEAAAVRESLAAFPALLPHGLAYLVPDAHHGWNGEFPELFSAMIKTWISRAPLPAKLLPIASHPDRLHDLSGSPS